MVRTLKFADIKSVDDSSRTRGIRIACGDDGRSCISLFFDDKALSIKQTDDLVRMLEKMKLSNLIVEIPS
jgi:hypothetical protein